MTDLFISYAHADSSLSFGEFSIKLLTETLQDRGYRLWMDVLSIPGGKHWADEIKKGIQGAKYLLVIATENSAISSYVAQEIQLAHQYAVAIIPIFFDAKHLTNLKLDPIQGINFSKSFHTAFEDLIAALPNVTPATGHLSYSDLNDILDDGTQTFEDVEKSWRSTLSFPKRLNAVGLLIGRSQRGMNAFLVGRRSSKLTQPDVVQVFLQFTDLINEPIFETYLEYIEARPNNALWTILIRAPIIHVEDKGYAFSLSDTDKTEWEEAVHFILANAIPKGRGTCRRVEFYLQAPGALIMALGLEENFNFHSDVYHFRRGNLSKEHRYQLVYSSKSS